MKCSFFPPNVRRNTFQRLQKRKTLNKICYNKHNVDRICDFPLDKNEFLKKLMLQHIKMKIELGKIKTQFRVNNLLSTLKMLFEEIKNRIHLWKD